MPRFFIGESGIVGDILRVGGEDALHISKSLRMSTGESIDLCDGKGTDYRCEIVSVGRDAVDAIILSAVPSESEPDVKITLFASVTKGERMDFLVQKSVELGVHEIVPVLSKRCVYQPDEKSEKNKLVRWNKISLEASKQSGRGYIPVIKPLVPFENALAIARNAGLLLIAYERGVRPLSEVIESDAYRTVSLFTGPEGGYGEEEVRMAEESGFQPISLGKRILRAETAPLCALSILLYQADKRVGSIEKG